MHTRQVILKGLGAGFSSMYFAMEEFFLGLLGSNKQFDQPGFDAAINNRKHPATISFRTRVRCLLEMLRIATVSTAVILFSNVVRVALEPVLNILCTRSGFSRDVYLVKDANITLTVSLPHCSAGRPCEPRHRGAPRASAPACRADGRRTSNQRCDTAGAFYREGPAARHAAGRTFWIVVGICQYNSIPLLLVIIFHCVGRAARARAPRLRGTCRC